MSRPNIILIHYHDLGIHFGCYGDTNALSPHIDGFAEESMLFESYYATSPTCTPSRASMLTGLYPHTSGLMGHCHGGHWELERSVPTLTSIIKTAGYVTASYGVWHLSQTLEGFMIDEGDMETDRNELCRKGIDFLRRHIDSSADPFLLLLGFVEPHLPWNSCSEDFLTGEIDLPGYLRQGDKTIYDDMRRFYTDVQDMDQSVGRILNYIDSSGLKESSIVIFTSDHGIGMPLAKGTLYDPGIHIPHIVRYPGFVPSGRSSELLSNVDLLPTICDACGLSDTVADDLDNDPWERSNRFSDPALEVVKKELTEVLERQLTESADPIRRGPIQAPSGYWEHWCAKGPGGFPPKPEQNGWLITKAPSSSMFHTCPAINNSIKDLGDKERSRCGDP